MSWNAFFAVDERVENVITAEGGMHPHKYAACHYLM
jgi:hypothetical protein